jgi:hypothetical protein
LLLAFSTNQADSLAASKPRDQIAGLSFSKLVLPPWPFVAEPMLAVEMGEALALPWNLNFSFEKHRNERALTQPGMRGN